MARRRNKRMLLASALYGVGIVHLAGGLRRLFGIGGPIFLMGHRVLPESEAQNAVDRMALLSGHAISPQELQRRLAFVQRWLMPAGDPAELIAGIPTRRAFYLTFDDGYRDNVVHAASVLDRLNIRAVIFFVADLLKYPQASPWWDRWGGEALQGRLNPVAAELDYGQRCIAAKRTFQEFDAADLDQSDVRRYLTRDELADLPVTFYAANHTRSHANLSALPDAGIESHIGDGQSALASHPRYLPLLAFPFGAYDARVLRHLRERSGYSIAFATGNGVDGDPLRAKRINLNVGSFAYFAAQCAGLMK
jgi:peptidoglycan/xylan/chitin deacetylase (PgdA/CDA1 family)